VVAVAEVVAEDVVDARTDPPEDVTLTATHPQDVAAAVEEVVVAEEAVAVVALRSDRGGRFDGNEHRASDSQAEHTHYRDLEHW